MTAFMLSVVARCSKHLRAGPNLRSNLFHSSNQSRVTVHRSSGQQLRSLSSDPKNSSDHEQRRSNTNFRTRFLVFGGGFLAIHFSVLFARHYHKNLKEKSDDEEIVITDVKDPSIKAGIVLQCKNFYFPFFAREALSKMETFATVDGDVIVASFPKSGTTWIQEIVYLIRNDVDLESARKVNMEHRIAYMEFIFPGINELAKIPGPRLLKTHMPYSFLPLSARQGKGKIIYIARNPKDVSVSYYFFSKMLKDYGFKGDFYAYYESFVEGKVPYGPWWQHVLEYWEVKNNPNVLFLTYEELKEDLPKCIKKVANFLGKSLSEQQISTIAEHTGFEAMRANPSTNYSWWDELGIKDKQLNFMRKGKVGDWKNHYTKEMQLRVDAMNQEHHAPHGIKFTDEMP